ncbi:uncharacterized protein LOC132700183 [Cylas formicarius]|uniref:uncharacterized protein LOC132700183 n=1 Tax=Cylas formicarius TaxID=197179 RepID=UPI002958920D|nr:uncharacterized protein LOC132700183 [Cylas formicarius]
MPKMAGKLRHARKKSVFFASDPKLERLVHNAWLEASLDAPQRVNPVPGYTQGLRRMCVILHVVIPLVKVLLGVLYINECPTNAWLPVYNIVGGAEKQFPYYSKVIIRVTFPGCLQFLFLALLIFRGIRKFWVLALIGAAMTIWLFVGE